MYGDIYLFLIFVAAILWHFNNKLNDIIEKLEKIKDKLK